MECAGLVPKIERPAADRPLRPLFRQDSESRRPGNDSRAANRSAASNKATSWRQLCKQGAAPHGYGSGGVVYWPEGVRTPTQLSRTW